MDDADHAELMDRIYRHQRFIYNLTRKYYLFGRDGLIRGLNLPAGAKLVEIGCGTGRNLIKIARRYPEAELFGLDASAEMLKTARAAIEHAGLSHRIHLAHGYAEEMTPATFGLDTPFDHALFSYSLSMIPDWRAAVAAALAALTEGGMLHAVDFADLTGLGTVGRSLLMGWLKLFHVAPRAELLTTFASAPAGTLRLLPGRYAFVLDIAKAQAISHFSAVAGLSQR
ncbi:MAG: class I SAM-dependent methyltransferase [Rhizomicrobium sp.]